jgi:hypothetical protein
MLTALSKTRSCLGFALAFVISCYFTPLQGQDFSNITKIGIGENENVAEVIDSKTDRLGNTYIIGSYYKKLVLGGKTYDGPNFIYNNFFVAKFDRSGNVVWSDDIYGYRLASSDLSRISIDKDGNAYIFGSFNREIFFTSSLKLSLPVTTNDGLSEAFVCKYRSDGTFDWARFIYGDHAVNEDGQILVSGKLHQGFASATAWQNFRNTRRTDTVRCYDRSSKFEFKAKNSWEDLLEINSAFPRFSPQGKNFVANGMRGPSFVISKFDLASKTFSDIVSIDLPTYVQSFDYHKDKICFLGNFHSAGTLQFGDVTVEASDPTGTNHYGEGYLVQYNTLTNKFEWGKLMDKSHDGLLVKISDAGNIITSTKHVGVSKPYYFRTYDAMGNFLWQQTSTGVTQDVKQIAIDRYENVYVTGWVGNGGFTYAEFGSLRFLYDYTVGFLARIQVSSCQPIAANASATICNGETFTLGDKTYSTAGTYTNTIKRVMGCDSVVTLQLAVLPAVPVTNLSATICHEEEFAFGNSVYNTTGIYSDTLKNVMGCDSLVVLNLTVRPQPFSQFSATICSGETYSFRDKVYNTAGTFSETLKNMHGCDSIVALMLTVRPPEPTTELSATICHGETYSFGDNVYNTTGIFEHTLKNIHGCDSVVTLQLTVRPAILTEHFASICSGESYFFNDKSYNEEGTYIDTLKSVAGCDSLISIQLSVRIFTPVIEINGNELKALPDFAEYRWTDCQSGEYQNTSQTITPDASGGYSVAVTYEGCTFFSDCFPYTVVGIEDESDNKLSISQTSDQIILTSKQGLRSVETVRLYTINGSNLVSLSSKEQDTISIPSSQLSPGIYIIHLTGRNYSNVARFVKQSFGR